MNVPLSDSCHVLVVEDDPAQAELLQENLAEVRWAGIEPSHAASLAGLFEVLERGPVDLVLLDLNLPDSQGLDTVRRTVARARGAPIVVLTGQDDPSMAMQAADAGADDFLTKDEVDPDRLARVIRYAIRHRELEARLEDGNQRMEALLQSAGNAIITADDRGSVLTFNQAAQTLFGYSPEEIVGTNVSRLMPEPYRGQHDDYIRHYEETGEKRIIGKGREVWGRHRDGSVFPIELNVADTGLANPREFIAIISDLRERREQEAKFRSLFELFPDATVLIDTETGLPVDFNTAARTQLGYTPEEFAQLTIPDYEARESPAQVAAHVRTILERGRDDFETRHRRKDGSELDVKVSVQRLELAGKTCFLAVFRDITEQKRVQRELENSEKRFLDVADAAGEYIWEIDGQGVYQLVTQQVESVLARPRAEILGHSPFEFMPADEAERVSQLLSEWATEKESWQGLEHRSLRPDGSVVYQRVSGLPILADDGTLMGYRGTGRDVTAEREAEAAREELTERLHLATSAAALGIWEYVPATERLEWDEGMFRIYGVSEDAFDHAYETWVRTITEDTREQALADLQQGLQSAEPYQSEFRIQRGDGEVRTIKAVAQAIRDEQGNLTRLIGINEDVTERKGLEQAMQDAQREAERASQAKSEFLANMSHEIRTPMNAVIGLGQLLLQTPLNERQHDYVQKIHESSRMLLGIINDILDFSKIEAGQLELEESSFQLSDVVEQMRTLFSSSASGKGVELLFHVPVGVPQGLVGDSLRLRQVLTNLIGNAIKFTHEGSVELDVEWVEREEDSATLRFSVTDTGIGLTEEQQGRLFQSFAQADTSTTRTYGGTGLGLVISRQLVNAMGGELEVESVPDQGSRFSFTLTLPVCDQAPNVLRCPETTGRRVLIVDDHETAREVVQNVLQNCGFTITEAISGEEALAKITAAEAAEQPFDFILLDWQMPGGMDGLTTLRQIERMHGEGELTKTRPPVLMVSAHDEAELEAEAEEGELSAFLSKPITPSTLFDALMAAEGRDGATARQRDVLKVPALGGRRILLAEDNEVNQEVALRMLEQTGAAVTLAENGARAVQRVEAEDFDLVLMDLQMPEMDGLEAAGRIRSLGRTMPIIALSAAVRTEDKEQSRAAGMDDHLGKPIDTTALYKTLSDWLGESAPAAEPPAQPSADPAPRPGGEAPLPAALPGFDLTRGRRLFDGDDAFYRKLLLRFRERLDQDFAPLPGLLREGDREAAGRLAHTLKGSAGALAAVELQELATRIDHAIQSGEAVAEATPGELQAALAQARATLAEFEVPETAGATSDDPGDLRTLREQLAASELVEDRTLEGALAYLRGITDEAQCQAIRDRVEEMDFEAASATLEEVLRASGIDLS